MELKATETDFGTATKEGLMNFAACRLVGFANQVEASTSRYYKLDKWQALVKSINQLDAVIMDYDLWS